jgi:hypothetical protein
MSSSDSVERLAFVLQLKRLVLAPPSKLLAHHDIYIKWSRGKQCKGKFHPVHCGSSLSHKTAGVPLMDIELPMTHQIAFDVNMRAKTSADGDTMIEKKTLDLVVNMFRYVDHRREILKSRSVAASVSVDIRSLLENMRVGIAKAMTIPLSEHEFIECEYVVTPAAANGGNGGQAGGGRAKTSLKSLIMDDDGEQLGDEPLDFPFVPAQSSGDDNLATADALLKAVIGAASRERGGVGMTPLPTMVEEGLFKAVTCKFPVDLLFDRLFSDKHGSFAAILHNARGDAQYVDANLSAPTHNGACATKAVRYSLRISKENYVDGVELSAVCAVGKDVFVHSVNFAPQAPIVGSDVRLEILLHLTPGPGPEESTVAMYAHAFVASSKLRFMFSSKIMQQVERLLYIMEEVVRQIIRTKICRGSTSAGAGGGRDRASLRFRNSLKGGSAQASGKPFVSSSLDPNLWRRLTEEHTLPHAEIIMPILQRLAKMTVARLSEMHIAALENVIGYHRTNIPIVTAACSVLVHLCRVCSPALVALCSSTLGMTLRSVFALHPSGVFGGFEQFLAQVESQIHSGKEKRSSEIAAERNYWHTLSTNLGVVEVVEVVMEKMATGGSRVAQVTTEEHLSLLAAALSLHLASERVVTSVFRMVDRLADFHLVTPSLCLAMGEAYKRHISLVVIFRPLMERVEQHERAFSQFEKLYGTAVNSERQIFSCSVLVNSPMWSATTLHLTKSFVCIGRQVLPLSELRKVIPYRSLLRPAVNFVFVATIDDYDMIVFSREELMNHLKELGLGKIIETEKS